LSRFDDLNSYEFDSNKEIEDFCKDLQKTCRDLFSTLTFAADALYSRLLTIPGDNRKINAKLTAYCLKKSADMIKRAGGLAVKCYRTFQFRYQVQLEAARKDSPKKGFEFKG
jgi:hypothetical protein